MQNHKKKMIAPIIIAILTVIYYLSISALFVVIEGIPMFEKCLFVIVPLVLSGVMICVLINRIEEIRSGEEDDLSKY